MRPWLCVIAFGAVLTAQTVDRTKPPSTPPIPSFKLPPVHEQILPNGLRVVTVEDARFPLVTLRLGFLAGMRFDPPDMPGLSEMTANLLTDGTKRRKSQQIAEELAAIGGALNGAAGADGLTIIGNALAENLPKLLDLTADVAINANFPEEEIQIRREQAKQGLESQMSEPSFLANTQYAKTVFGSSGYGHISATLESLDKIGRKDMMAFRDANLVPNNGILLLVGKLPPQAQTMKLISQHFGAWQKGPAHARATSATVPPAKRQLILVDRPGSVQADIHVGRIAVTRKDPDYFPLAVVNMVLGGGGSSRMFLDMREKEGFAYDAHSQVDPKALSGTVTAVTQVRNEVIEPAMKLLLDELRRISADPPSPQELELAKNFMNGVYLLRLETQSGLADQLMMMRLVGLPDNYLETYTANVRNVDAAAAGRVARKYLDPANASIVVVGDASKIGDSLKKFGEVTVVKAQ